MHVSDLIDDLAEALAKFPESADWRIGVATYTDGPGSDISVMHVASYGTDPDEEFFLVPEGMGEAFGLAERPFTAKQLLDELQAHPEWAGHPVCARKCFRQRAQRKVCAVGWHPGLLPPRLRRRWHHRPGSLPPRLPSKTCNC